MRSAMRVALLVGVGAVFAAVGGSAPPKDEPKLPTKKEVMAAKLKHTQGVLEGIALNDFDKIDEAAAELARVTKATDFLNAYKGDDYQFELNTFKRAVAMVGKKAKDKNMDGVMVAYNDLTLSCLKCHQAMRDKKFDAARTDPAAPRRGE
jgi:cytochrome c556